MADQTQRYTVTQSGGVLGTDHVETSPNQTSPQRETTIIRFRCPRKFDAINYVGQRDNTRFVPRTTQTLTAGTGDDTVVSLDSRISPVAGEEDIADQEYPVVVAYNVDTSTQYDITNIDYSANEVTLGTDPSDTETVKLFPVLTEGTVQYRVVNQFDQEEGRVYPWAVPVYRWSDFNQLQAGREINLHGSATTGENEWLEVIFDGPHAITWEDTDYPEGSYVSTFEQDVEITL